MITFWHENSIPIRKTQHIIISVRFSGIERYSISNSFLKDTVYIKQAVWIHFSCFVVYKGSEIRVSSFLFSSGPPNWVKINLHKDFTYLCTDPLNQISLLNTLHYKTWITFSFFELELFILNVQLSS